MPSFLSSQCIYYKLETTIPHKIHAKPSNFFLPTLSFKKIYPKTVTNTYPADSNTGPIDNGTNLYA